MRNIGKLRSESKKEKSFKMVVPSEDELSATRLSVPFKVDHNCTMDYAFRKFSEQLSGSAGERQVQYKGMISSDGCQAVFEEIDKYGTISNSYHHLSGLAEVLSRARVGTKGYDVGSRIVVEYGTAGVDEDMVTELERNGMHFRPIVAGSERNGEVVTSELTIDTCEGFLP